LSEVFVVVRDAAAEAGSNRPPAERAVQQETSESCGLLDLPCRTSLKTVVMLSRLLSTL